MKTFKDIRREFINNKNYMKINEEYHHGITRFEHSERVAYHVYKYAVKHNLDYVSATRGAFLHDFFLKDEVSMYKGLKVGSMHPGVASTNARINFKINELEDNMIKAHMFPLGYELPHSKEAWLLTVVDKLVATYEFITFKFTIRKAYRKISYTLGLLSVFILNIIMMDKS